MSLEAKPLVSIITPTYNRADYLPETIDSVLSQDYPNIEYIVLDDGSKDNTQEVLAQYNGKLFWETHANIGEVRTVNKGYAMAKGEIIAVINSDDPALPGLVSAMVNFMQTHPDVLVVYPDWRMIDAESKTLQEMKTYDYDFVNMIRWHHCVPGPGTFISRRALELEPTRDPQFRYVSDVDFWFRLGLHGSFARLPQTLATFRFHPGSASNAAKGVVMAEEHIRLTDKFYSQPNLPPAILGVRSESYSAAYYIAAVQCMNDRHVAGQYFLKSILQHRNSYPNGLPRSWELMLDFILPPRLHPSAKRLQRLFKRKEN